MATFFTLFIKLMIIVRVHFVSCDQVWTPYRKLASYDLGNVYNSTNYIKSVSVKNKAQCAVVCNDMGSESCLSFNVIPDKDTLRCELFDHRPTQVADLLISPSGVFYEELCPNLNVKAATKETLLNGDTLVMLVDDKRRVFHVRQSSPGITMIGRLEEVFVGFTGTFDEIIVANVKPFGDIHVIRVGQLFHCFKPVTPKNHDKFEFCQPGGLAFPYFDLFENSPVLPIEELLWTSINRGSIDALFVGEKAIITRSNEWTNQASLSSSQQYAVNFTEVVFLCDLNEQFCPYQVYFHDSNSGLHLSGNIWGVFLNGGFYTINMTLGHTSVIERHSVCVNEDANYLF